jgi:hypothetical protein
MKFLCTFFFFSYLLSNIPNRIQWWRESYTSIEFAFFFYHVPMVIICEWIITHWHGWTWATTTIRGEASYHGGSVTRFLPRFVYLPPTLGLTSESPFFYSLTHTCMIPCLPLQIYKWIQCFDTVFICSDLDSCVNNFWVSSLVFKIFYFLKIKSHDLNKIINLIIY